jgi:hypothetical protein
LQIYNFSIFSSPCPAVPNLTETVEERAAASLPAAPPLSFSATPTLSCLAALPLSFRAALQPYRISPVRALPVSPHREAAEQGRRHRRACTGRRLSRGARMRRRLTHHVHHRGCRHPRLPRRPRLRRRPRRDLGAAREQGVGPAPSLSSTMATPRWSRSRRAVRCVGTGGWVQRRDERGMVTCTTWMSPELRTRTRRVFFLRLGCSVEKERREELMCMSLKNLQKPP